MAEELATVYIKRSNNSHKDGEWVEYNVPLEEDMTVLGVLDYIYENIDSSLAYYQSCRFGRCKGCLVSVDGKTVLSCDSTAKDGMKIAPVEKFKVIRDLVVDLNKPVQSKKEKGGGGNE